MPLTWPAGSPIYTNVGRIASDAALIQFLLKPFYLTEGNVTNTSSRPSLLRVIHDFVCFLHLGSRLHRLTLWCVQALFSKNKYWVKVIASWLLQCNLEKCSVRQKTATNTQHVWRRNILRNMSKDILFIEHIIKDMIRDRPLYMVSFYEYIIIHSLNLQKICHIV